MSDQPKVWVIGGPRREFDFYVFPADEDGGSKGAYEHLLEWIEQECDQLEADSTPSQFSIEHRTATAEDLEILAAYEEDPA